MKILHSLFRSLLLFEVQIDKDKIIISPKTVKSGRNGLKYIDKEWNSSFTKREKNNIAVMKIFGDQVMTKIISGNSSDIKKITENNSLLWSKKAGNDNEIVLSFLRKECVNEIIESIESQNILILDYWIDTCRTENEDSRITAFYNEILTVKSVRNSRLKLNSIVELTFMKIRLPVLLFFFIVLAGNAIYSEQLRKDIEEKQLIYNTKAENLKQRNDNLKKISCISTQYEALNRKYFFSLFADRIASYLPQNIKLVLISINPVEGNIADGKEIKIKSDVIVIKGEVDIPGSLISYSQNLEHDKLFRQVKINSITQQKGSDQFDFELQIVL